VDAALSPYTNEADAYTVERWRGKRCGAGLGAGLATRPEGGAKAHRGGRLQELTARGIGQATYVIEPQARQLGTYRERRLVLTWLRRAPSVSQIPRPDAR